MFNNANKAHSFCTRLYYKKFKLEVSSKCGNMMDASAIDVFLKLLHEIFDVDEFERDTFPVYFERTSSKRIRRHFIRC